MDTNVLGELMVEVNARGGGLVLNQGPKPLAVVLSVEKYHQLLQGVPVMDMDISLQESIDANAPKGTVLVTGGAGYIGGHVVHTLLDSGYRVVVVDNLSTGRREHIPEGVVFYEGDIADGNFLRNIFSQHEFSAVLHLAASLEVEESVMFPLRYLHNNTFATFQLLTVMHEFGVKAIVFSSTAAVYGEQDVVPIAETAVPQPNNPYGYSKLLAEEVLKYFSETMGFGVIILRYFNVCGANPEWNVGDTHKNSHLIPIILEVAGGNQQAMVVNGGDYPTPDGSCIRDYVHVQDIARAHVYGLQAGVAGQYKIYNVGTGKGLSVKEMIQAASEVTGKMIPMDIGPRRAGDAGITIADNKKITQELGFTLKYSDLQTIFSSSWQIARRELLDK